MTTNKNAPTEINISAKLKIAKYFTPIKSVTEPTNTLSSPLEIAPDRINTYAHLVSRRFLYVS